jgi:hypothetical protein
MLLMDNPTALAPSGKAILGDQQTVPHRWAFEPAAAFAQGQDSGAQCIYPSLFFGRC